MPTRYDLSKRLRENVPFELREWPQWVAYTLKPSAKRPGKTDKIPFDPKSNRPARVNSADTWASFSEAMCAIEQQEAYAGVGYVLAKADPFVGVDLDDSIDEEGTIKPWAQAIVMEIGSYTEISPSGRGLHILCKGELPKGGRRSGHVEMYEEGRFLTVTGLHYAGSPEKITECTERLASIHAQYLSRPSQEPVTRTSQKPVVQRVASGSSVPMTSSDAAVLGKARGAANSAKFKGLYDTGNIYSYPSSSEADLALATLLAYWTDWNPQQMDRLFRNSALYRPKWDESRSGDGITYGQMTIQRALHNQKGWVAGAKSSAHTTTKGGSDND